MVSRIQLNYWKNLEFYDPVHILRVIKELEARPIYGSGAWDFDKNIQRAAKLTLAKLDAALVSYLLGEYIGVETAFAPVESLDYDCIVRFNLTSEQSFNPVQLKEIVPFSVNPNFSLSSFLNSLRKYADSKDLIVAIKVGRELGEMSQPVDGLGFGGLFLYGQDPLNPNRLWLRGDCQHDSRSYDYNWPG
jgi:hypothetical protein